MSTTPIDGAIAVNRRELLRGLVISIALAGSILVAAILPAEYGIDPLGIGRVLGLTKLRQPASETAAAVATLAPSATTPTVQGATQTARQAPAYRSDTREVHLAPGKGIEIKTRLEKGAALSTPGRRAMAPRSSMTSTANRSERRTTLSRAS